MFSLCAALCLTLCSGFALSASEAEPWREAYAALLRDERQSYVIFDTITVKFGLTDMDGDSIPELIIFDDYLAYCRVYIYTGGAAELLEEYGGGTAYWAEPLTDGIVAQFRGEDEVFWTLKDGRMVTAPFTGSSPLTVYDITSANIQTYISEAQTQELPDDAPPPESNISSSWAAAEVNMAIAAGLVPDSIVNAGWKNSTSRLAAADGIIILIEKASGKTIDQIAAERGWDLSTNQFSDTDSKAVTFLRHAGITTGKGNNLYAPYDSYNRSEFVTMLGRTAEKIFGITARRANPFPDKAPSWADQYIGYAAENSITLGSGGIFDSYGILQNQQMAMFCYRAYAIWK